MKKRLVCIFTLVSIMMALFSNAFVVEVNANAEEWLWPIPTSTNKATTLSRGYWYNSSSDYHAGVDIAVGVGSSVMASKSGTVWRTYTGCGNYSRSAGNCSSATCGGSALADKSGGYCGQSYGNAVFVMHSDGKISIYGHLSEVCVNEGDTVTQGQLIGKTGSTGNSSGPHLHFQITTKTSKWSANSINNNPSSISYIYRENIDEPVDPYVNLGDDFYAVILQRQAWIPLVLDDDNFVRLHTEQGRSRELWRFKRQEDGSYVILSAKTGKALEMYCGNNVEGTQIAACSEDWGGAYQRWYIYEQANGYVIMSKHFSSENWVLDLRHDQKTDGTDVIIYPRNNSDVQIWAIYKGDEVQLGRPTLTVTPGNNNKKTKFEWNDVHGESGYHLKIWKNKVWEGDAYDIEWNTHSGVEVQLPPGTYEAYVDASNYFQNKGGDEVRFIVAEEAISSGKTIKDGKYKIVSAANEDYSLEVKDNSSASAAKIQIRQGSNQTFNIKYQDKGYYTITSSSSGNSLDAYNYGTAPNTEVRSCNYHGDVNQQWVIKNLSGDYYYIVNRFNGLYLNIYDATVQNGQGVILWGKVGTNVQIWKLIPYTFSITYNANGGTNAPNEQIKDKSKSITLSTAKPTRNGYVFTNWLGSNGKIYNPGDTYNTDEDLILTAQWKKTQYTIQYNINGGEGSISSSTYADGTTGKISSVIPKRDGYKFIGWSDNQTATEAKYQSNDNYMENEDVTLYAVWKALPSTKTMATKKTGYTLLNVAVNNADIGTNVIIAVYLNGRLADIQKEEYNGKNLSIAEFEKYDTIKVMLWDDLRSLQPLCPAEIIIK